jgi:hypothetical protein
LFRLSTRRMTLTGLPHCCGNYPSSLHT